MELEWGFFLPSHFTEVDGLASRPTRHLLLPIRPRARMHQFFPPATPRALGGSRPTACSGIVPLHPHRQRQPPRSCFTPHPITHVLPEVAQPLLVLSPSPPHPHARLDLGKMFEQLDTGRTTLGQSKRVERRKTAGIFARRSPPARAPPSPSHAAQPCPALAALFHPPGLPLLLGRG